MGAYPTVDEKKGLGFAADAWMPLAVEPKLVDLADYRLGLMDEAGVDYAVLSVTSPAPSSSPSRWARRSPETPTTCSSKSPRSIPSASVVLRRLLLETPEWSAQEFERCVKELGFKGLNTHSNYGDSYLDEKRYGPSWPKQRS